MKFGLVVVVGGLLVTGLGTSWAKPDNSPCQERGQVDPFDARPICGTAAAKTAETAVPTARAARRGPDPSGSGSAAKPETAGSGSAGSAAGSAAVGSGSGSAAAPTAVPTVPAPAPVPAVGSVADNRAACVAAMNADPTFEAAIIATTDKKAAEARDAETVKRHKDAADMVALNQRHVILSYAAMWIIAALFVIFLWRRQQGLKVELANLKRDLEAATKDAK